MTGCRVRFRDGSTRVLWRSTLSLFGSVQSGGEMTNSIVDGYLDQTYFERLGISGFRRGRRFIAVAGAPSTGRAPADALSLALDAQHLAHERNRWWNRRARVRLM